MLHIVICAGLSVAAYFAGKLVFPGRTVEVEAEPDTGDIELNRQIKEGRLALKALRDANDAITSPDISAQLDRMEAAGLKIFDEIERASGKASQVRRFMNYYLPTSVKLLERYRALSDAGGGGDNIAAALSGIEKSLHIIADSFEKQLDNLYAADSLDITADIKVLETMLAGEGLTELIIGKGDTNA
jgi:5-bromo-4-chloroindolyl phosphate hydrolysis protein